MASLDQAFNTLLDDKEVSLSFMESDIPELGSYISPEGKTTYLRDIPAQKPSNLNKYQNYKLQN